MDVMRCVCVCVRERERESERASECKDREMIKEGNIKVP